MCRSCLFIVFCPIDTFHLLIYFIYLLSFVINHGYIELNWICFLFYQKDGFFESFNRDNRVCLDYNR